MRKAQDQRQVGETNMNKQSSRSHCIFTLKVQAKRKVGDGSLLEVSGKLHCVDLAGSECAKSADLDKNDDQQASRERERMNINRSLLTLGRVVSMLKEQSQGKKNKNMRIPYRDSKLTRILQESLGGRCKTCLIATVSPSVTAIEESMSTLNYAQAANGIINKPVTSSLMTAQNSSAPMNGEKKSNSEGASVEHWHEMEVRLQYMQSQVEEAQQALARKHLQQQELMDRTEAAEAAKAAAEAELEEAQHEKVILREEIERHISEKQELSTKLWITEKTLKETIVILKATQQTEKQLTLEAQALLSLLQRSIDDGDSMYDRLLKHREDDVSRKEATRIFSGKLLALLDNTLQGLSSLEQYQKNQSIVMKENTAQHANVLHECIEGNQHTTKELTESVTSMVVALQKLVKDSMVDEASAFASQMISKICDYQNIHNEKCSAAKSVSESLRADLDTAQGEMMKREENYVESSRKMLDELQADVTESKSNLSELIQSIAEALKQGHQQRKESQQALSNMIADWKETAVEDISAISYETEMAVDNTNNLIEILANEKQRHETLGQILADQSVYLEERCSAHFSQLKEQRTILETHTDALEVSKKRADEIYDSVMKNIMSGVQDLVQREFVSIKEHQNTSSAEHEEAQRRLAKSNKSIADSFNATLSELGANNASMQSHGKILRETDEITTETLRKTSDSLRRVHTKSQGVERLCHGFADSAMNHLEEASRCEKTQVGSLCSSMEQQRKEFGEQLHSTIFEKAVPRTDDLVKSVESLVSYTKASLVVPTSKCLLENIEAPIASAIELSERVAKEIATDLSTYQQSVDEFATRHDSRLIDFQAKSLNGTAQLSSSLSDQSKAISEYKAKSLEICTATETMIAKSVEKESGMVSTAKGAVDNFANTVIQVDSEAKAVEPRSAPSYSKNLSSTPADHIILQSIEKIAVESSEVATDDTESIKETNVTAGDRVQVMETEIPDDTNYDSTISSMIPVLREKTNTGTESSPAALEDQGQVAKRRAGASTRARTSSKRVRTKK